MAKLDNVEKHTGKGKKGSIGDAAGDNDAIRQWDDHTWSLEKLQENLATSIETGLSHLKAEVKLKEFGPNELTEKEGTPWYVLFMKEQTGLFSLLLYAGSILCYIGYGLQPADPSNLYLGIILDVVCFFTGVFAYSQ